MKLCLSLGVVELETPQSTKMMLGPQAESDMLAIASASFFCVFYFFLHITMDFYCEFFGPMLCSPLPYREKDKKCHFFEEKDVIFYLVDRSMLIMRV